METATLQSGPLDAAEAAGLPAPPLVQVPQAVQLLRFNQRQIQFVFGARRRLGDVFALRTPEPQPLVVTSLPVDVRSLFTAKPDEAPSLAAESPLRPSGRSGAGRWGGPSRWRRGCRRSPST